MKEEINFESIAKQYKCAVAAKYRPLKPEEIGLIPSGKIFVSKKIDGELWLAHINQNGATLFSKGGRFIKEGIIIESLKGCLPNNIENLIVAGELYFQKDSRERVGDEITKILSGENAHEIALKMDSLGVFGRVFEEYNVDIPPQLSNNHLVNLALLFRNEDISGKSLSDRLRGTLVLSKNSLTEISIMHECRNLELDCSIESLRRFKVVVPETRREMILQYLEKSGVDLRDFREALRQAENEDLIISPIIKGDKLAEVTGLVPGPRLGKLKAWLHRKQIESALRTESDLIALLSEFNWKRSNYEEWDILQWP